MFCKNKQLCPTCKTGKESYELDPFSDDCPHIVCYKNNKCPFYVPLENQGEKSCLSETKEKFIAFYKKYFCKNT